MLTTLPPSVMAIIYAQEPLAYFKMIVASKDVMIDAMMIPAIQIAAKDVPKWTSHVVLDNFSVRSVMAALQLKLFQPSPTILREAFYLSGDNFSMISMVLSKALELSSEERGRLYFVLNDDMSPETITAILRANVLVHTNLSTDVLRGSKVFKIYVSTEDSDLVTVVCKFVRLFGSGCALLEAMSAGRLDVARIAMEADVNGGSSIPDSIRTQIIDLACREYNAFFVANILDWMGDKNIKYIECLVAASKKGDLDLVVLILSRIESSKQVCSLLSPFQCPFYITCRHGHMDILEVMLESPSLHSFYIEDAINVAARNGNTDVVSRLRSVTMRSHHISFGKRLTYP